MFTSQGAALSAASYGLQRTCWCVSSGRTLPCVLLALELIRFAHMALAPTSGPIEERPSAAVEEFARQHYVSSGAQQFGFDQASLAAVLAQVVSQAGHLGEAAAEMRFLA